MRDFDPSILVAKTHGDSNTQNWWFPTRYTYWSEDKDIQNWLQDDAELPVVEDLIQVTNPSDNSSWFVMQSFCEWVQPLPPTEKLYESPTRRLWYMLKSYVVRKSDANTFYEWAIQQDFMGKWMPESHSVLEVFMGEFFWAPAFQYHRSPQVGYHDWETFTTRGLEAPVVVTADEYLWEDIYDCSIDDSIHIYTPSRWLADQMGLTWRGIEGQFHNSSHELVTLDPSIREEGPRALLFSKPALVDFLAREEYEIFWTVLGEKQVVWNRSFDEYPGQFKINGVYRLIDGKVSGTFRSEFIAPNSRT